MATASGKPCETLGQLGARVAVVDMAQKNIDRVVKDIQAMGGEAIGIQANVTSEADTARYIKGTLTHSASSISPCPVPASSATAPC